MNTESESTSPSPPPLPASTEVPQVTPKVEKLPEMKHSKTGASSSDSPSNSTLGEEKFDKKSWKPHAPANPDKFLDCWNQHGIYGETTSYRRTPLFGYYFTLFLMVSSGFGVLPVLLPALVLNLFGPRGRRVYRAWIDFWVGLFLQVGLGMAEWVLGVGFFSYGDAPPADGANIFTLNHRTLFDYLWFWSFLSRCPFNVITKFKVVLKYELKHCPCLGWAIQLASFFFLKRKWDQDKQRISEQVDFFCAERKYPINLLIFPEGTDYCANGCSSSWNYARKAGLPQYQYSLHPRTTGLINFINKFKEWNNLDAVYDVTVGYPVSIPEGWFDVLKGRAPQQVHFYWKKYDVNELPTDEEELKKWCEARGAEKEARLKKFYEEGRFPGGPSPGATHLQNIGYFIGLVAVIFWHLKTAMWMYLFFTCFWVRVYYLVTIGWAIVMTFSTSGLDCIEHWCWRRDLANKRKASQSDSKKKQ